MLRIELFLLPWVMRDMQHRQLSYPVGMRDMQHRQPPVVGERDMQHRQPPVDGGGEHAAHTASLGMGRREATLYIPPG